jgi:hypothetical protein
MVGYLSFLKIGPKLLKFLPGAHPLDTLLFTKSAMWNLEHGLLEPVCNAGNTSAVSLQPTLTHHGASNPCSLQHV